MSISPFPPETDLSNFPLTFVEFSKTLRFSPYVALAFLFAMYPTIIPKSFLLYYNYERKKEISASSSALTSSLLAISLLKLSITF